MIFTLTRDPTVFPITDGVGRIYKTLEKLESSLRQNTQVGQPSRGAWPVAFPDRASRTLSFSLPVMYPPCASYEEAFAQAHNVPMQCPRGGVLTGLLDGTLITYPQAWVSGITSTTIGVTNHFVFTFSAVNPTATTPSPLALMDARYLANLSSITALTGGASTDLDAQITADVTVGFQASLFVPINGLWQLAFFRLIAGMNATNVDPDAGPVVVRGLDYNAATNANIWMRIDA